MITAYNAERDGNFTTVTVISDLGGTIYYHWYCDGALLCSTQAPSHTFWLPAAEQSRIEVLDTNDPDFDAVANAPAGYPARKTLWWIRSPAEDVLHYRVEQKQDAGAWAQIAELPAVAGQWDYTLITDRLTDLAEYTWRVVAVDELGNESTAAVIGPERIVRIPDAVEFEIAFDPETTRVTFAAAA